MLESALERTHVIVTHKYQEWLLLQLCYTLEDDHITDSSHQATSHAYLLTYGGPTSLMVY